MDLNEVKELLENAVYIVEGAKTDDTFLAHINRQRTTKPRTNLLLKAKKIEKQAQSVK